MNFANFASDLTSCLVQLLRITFHKIKFFTYFFLYIKVFRLFQFDSLTFYLTVFFYHRYSKN